MTFCFPRDDMLHNCVDQFMSYIVYFGWQRVNLILKRSIVCMWYPGNAELGVRNTTQLCMAVYHVEQYLD